MKRMLALVLIAALALVLIAADSMATISVDRARVVYTGSGSTGPFSVPFYFSADSDLLVIKTDAATLSSDVILTLDVDYTVTGAGSTSGSITLTSTLSSTYRLIIMRSHDFLQEHDYEEQGPFTAATHEAILDKHTMELQQLKDVAGRSVQLPRGYSGTASPYLPAPAPSKLIGWNALGTALQYYTMSSGGSGGSSYFDNISNYGNSLTTMVAALGATPAIVMIDSGITQSDNVTIPSNIQLLIPANGAVNVASGSAVTFWNPAQITAGLYQIFGGDGLVRFEMPGTVFPEWWQTNTEGTDMAPAINKAMIAGGAGSTIKFNAGVYLLKTISKCEDLPACGQDAYLENYFVNLLDDRTIKCEGWGSVIKVGDHIFDQSDDDTSNAHVFQGFDIENVSIEGCMIDMNGYNNLSPSGKTRNSMAVRLDDGGSNVLIDGLYVLNNPGHNNVVANNTSLASKATGLTVRNCVMYGGGTGVLGNTNNVDFSFVYSEWTYTSANNNRLEQPAPTYTWSGGIELHASYSEANDNIIIHCDPAVWIASCNNTEDGDPNIDNLLVNGNVFRDCQSGVAFWPCGRIRDTTISNNTIRIKWRGGADIQTYGVHMISRGGIYPWTDELAAGDVIVNTNIVGNTFVGEDDATRYVKMDGHGIYATSVRGLNIKDNTFYNLPGDGVIIGGSPYGLYDIVVQNNYFRNWGRGLSGVGNAAIRVDIKGGPAISWDTDVYVPDEGEFKLRNMLIAGNYFEKDDNSTDANGKVVTSYPIVLSADDAITAGQMYNVEIRDNIDWLCTDTTSGFLGGELGYVDGAPWGVFYKPNREWSAIADPDGNAIHYPDGYHYGGEIAWNRNWQGSVAGVGVGKPLGWVCTVAGSPGTWEPFGIIGAWKIGTYANRPAAVVTTESVPYVCTDCTKCRASGPTLMYWVHSDLKWYCDNSTAIVEAGVSE